MSAVAIKGLDRLKWRLDGRHLSRLAKGKLRQEADVVAAGAAREAPGRLGQTVEVIDESREDKIAFAVGSAHRAGRFLEHGTVRRPATPWLWPVFRARLPRIKQGLRNTVIAAMRTSQGEV